MSRRVKKCTKLWPIYLIYLVSFKYLIVYLHLLKCVQSRARGSVDSYNWIWIISTKIVLRLFDFFFLLFCCCCNGQQPVKQKQSNLGRNSFDATIFVFLLNSISKVKRTKITWINTKPYIFLNHLLYEIWDEQVIDTLHHVILVFFFFLFCLFIKWFMQRNKIKRKQKTYRK